MQSSFLVISKILDLHKSLRVNDVGLCGSVKGRMKWRQARQKMISAIHFTRKRGIGHWALGIGHWALGDGGVGEWGN